MIFSGLFNKSSLKILVTFFFGKKGDKAKNIKAHLLHLLHHDFVPLRLQLINTS